MRSLAPPSDTNDLDDPHNANDAHHAQQAELDPHFQEEAELGRVCWMFPEFPGHFNIFQLLISPTLNVGPMAIAGSLVINMGSVAGIPWVLSRLEIPHVHRSQQAKDLQRTTNPVKVARNPTVAHLPTHRQSRPLRPGAKSKATTNESNLSEVRTWQMSWGNHRGIKIIIGESLGESKS